MGQPGGCFGILMKAMAGSEGSEQERYAKIVAELAMGKAVCTDGEE